MLNTIDYCLNGEEWRDIPSYEGIYQASNYGRIRTVHGKITHSVKHGERKWEGRILKPKASNAKTGYRVSLWKNKKFKEYLVARLIGFTFLGIPDELAMTINHKDGNRFNNYLVNIEWLSLPDNIRHAFANDLMNTNKVITIKVLDKTHSFNSLAEASKHIGRSHGYFSNCLQRNKKGTTADGYLVEIV